MKNIFDFFVSYKTRDSAAFTTKVAAELKLRGYDVWLDNDEIRPGDSILSSIESGMTSSIDAVLILSEHYFDGWSEHERRAVFSLMISKKIRIVPIWYKLDHRTIQRAAPMLADIKGIQIGDDSDASIVKACDGISNSFRPDQRRARLYELFFRCLVPHFPEDMELKLFLAVYDNDLEALKQACDAGVDLNITDAALWNRYNKKSLDCGCFNEFRKLYLYLHEAGLIGKNNPKQA